MSHNLEDDAYEAQENWIKEHCGEEAAQKANYGWFVDEVDGLISTKIYGHGIITTEIGDPTNFTFESFSEPTKDWRVN